MLSPEKTVLTVRLAGIGTRILAHLLDLFISTMILVILGLLTLYLVGSASSGMAQGIAMVLYSLGYFAYFIILESIWNGCTFGKKALSIRVRMADGTPVTFLAVLSRNLLRPADFLPVGYFVGMACMMMNPRAQRLGDWVGNTIVIQEPATSVGFRPAPHAVSFHPLEAHVGELRGMTLEEYRALKSLCDRFPELPQRVQEKLLLDVWQPIAHRRAVPNVAGVHPVHMAEATVMRYGRIHGLL